MMGKYVFKQPMFYKRPLDVKPREAEQHFSRYELCSGASKGVFSGCVREWLALWERSANGLIEHSYWAPAPFGTDIARPWPLDVTGLLLKLSEHIDEIEQHADGYIMQSFAAVSRWYLSEHESFSDAQIVSALGLVRAWQAINILFDGLLSTHTPSRHNPILKALGNYYAAKNKHSINELASVQKIALMYAAKAKQLIGLVESCSWVKHDTAQQTIQGERRGQSKGGKKSGATRRQENAKRDQGICNAFLQTPEKQKRDFASMQAKRHGLASKTIRDILKNGGVWGE